jgi:uncharacterized delta-60 repeat protein
LAREEKAVLTILRTDPFTDSGASWAFLGAGIRIPGGWQLSGFNLPANTTYRARGYAVGGLGAASSWFVEAITSSLGITVQPASITNNAGTSAVFSVLAFGNGPLGYRWRKGGFDLADGGNVSGSAAASLTLSNLLGGDAGGYSVVISNASGNVTSKVATLTVIEPVVSVQPISQAKFVGDSVTFSVAAIGSQPLAYQWRHDGSAQTGATQASLTLTNLHDADSGGYDAVVSSSWGVVTSAVANLSVGFNPGANGAMYSLAVQADGKIVAGGNFTSIAGQSRSYIGRFNADGTLDAGFNPGASFMVNCLAVQTDGKLLVGGGFVTLGGQNCYSIGRLNADGTPDPDFHPGADNFVFTMAVQDDGKILVGGAFTSLAGQNRNHIGRLNADGTLDTSFNPDTDGSVSCLALQPDGKLLVGGSFVHLNGASRTNFGRFYANGTLDTSFNPSANDGVSSLTLQADGKILVGGRFTVLAGQNRTGIGRFNADGTLDNSFNPGANGPVNCLAVQADGKIVLGGQFTTLGGIGRANIGRLNADGTVDTSFDPGADSGVLCLALQADGRILAGGQFTSLGGLSCNNIGRLNNTAPANQSLVFDGSRLTWTRRGTSPEVWRTTFDYSLDGGGTWTILGGGVRIPGGWQLSGPSLPANTAFRARGYTLNGFVETTVSRGPLVITNMLAAGTKLMLRGTKGVANGTYYLMSSTNLSLPLTSWTCIATNTFDASGNFNSTNNLGLPSQRQFFLLRFP